MPKFLTTAGLNYHLEELLKNAEKEFLIISPYIQLQQKIRDILKLKKTQGLKIDFACRMSDLNRVIRMFKKLVYTGQYKVASQPYKAGGEWR